MGDMVEFPSNGHMANGYLALPQSGSGQAVIVIQEWWGLVPHIKEVADRFAEAGFVALAPDLYNGTTTEEPNEAGKLMMALELDRAAKEIGGAVDYLLTSDATTGDGVGVVGFCMGGGLALWLATKHDGVAAAVPFYGALWPGVDPDFTTTLASFQGHYAEVDEWATQESARSMEQTLHESGRDAEFFFYDGTGHGFFNDSRPEAYVEDAAETAWARTVAFLGDRL